MFRDVATDGPLFKAKESVGVFVRNVPSLGTLLANRTQHFERAHAVLPSDAVVGESVELTVQAWDQCERLVDDFRGSFALAATDPDADHPEEVRFDPHNGGVTKLRELSFETPGVHYLVLTHDESGERFVTNPVRVHETEPDRRLYWGDIHLHSQISDGTGSMAKGMRFGRDVMALDVVAYTDHDTMGFFIPPSWQQKRMHRDYFDRMKSVTDDFHDPGEFVTLMAYEWTKQPNRGGHINVYFDGVDEAELFDSIATETDTYEKLWDRLREWNESGEGQALTIPHHPAEKMYPFDFSAMDYDDELAPLVEVYSQWGSSERPGSDGNQYPLAMGQGEVDEPGHYVQDALELGYRVGMVASADYHGPHPGHSLIHADAHLPSLAEWREDGLGWANIWRVWDEGSYPGGLNAFSATDLSRDGIFDALADRRVYGTTQPHRIVVDFAVDGTRVGENDSTVVVDDAETERTVEVDVAGTAPLERVEVVKNNEVLADATTLTSATEGLAASDGGVDDGDGDGDEFAVTHLENGSLAESVGDTVDLSEYVCTATVTDDEPVTGMAWDEERGTDADVYYVRVTQTDGGMAWVGPVWVEVA
ncbi:Protein of unknown function [Halogranum gelatinilyticum]|uniref:DUF3604 domain-containing protein n=1 Tax=Halogranum gelatinilyticum TaxID=660521 RepID=A0A1G9TT50_9EURY|nr:DUF3604 domain-containing protein [Halogranum gelatinilyticum]SDM50909.1 Protein of unknown function [Halogranum gelatinilyticum]